MKGCVRVEKLWGWKIVYSNGWLIVMWYGERVVAQWTRPTLNSKLPQVNRWPMIYNSKRPLMNVFDHKTDEFAIKNMSTSFGEVDTFGNKRTRIDPLWTVKNYEKSHIMFIQNRIEWNQAQVWHQFKHFQTNSVVRGVFAVMPILNEFPLLYCSIVRRDEVYLKSWSAPIHTRILVWNSIKCREREREWKKYPIYSDW